MIVRAQSPSQWIALLTKHLVAVTALVGAWGVCAIVVGIAPEKRAANSGESPVAPSVLGVDDVSATDASEIPLAPSVGVDPACDREGRNAERLAALAGVVRIDDDTVRIDAATVQFLLSRCAEFGHRLHLVPQFTSGRAVGLKIFRIAEDSVLHVMGFESGDVVTQVGAWSLTTPDGVRRAVEGFQTAKTISVDVRRQGTKVTRVIELGSR